MSLISFEIDPLKVLGVTSDASLDQIRDAYRQKAKRFHPDAGGEEWVFRILSQAYELLCSARVLRAAHFESPRPSVRPAPTASPRPPRRDLETETVHAGLHDKDLEPSHIVAVEHLCVRYLWDHASYLWLGQAVPDQERFLSCSLNLSWPDETRPDRDDPIPERGEILAALGEIFDAVIISTSPVNSRSSIEDDRFSGWLSYSSFDRSSKALQALHQALRTRGLGLRQWSRDLFLPRAWQFDRKEA
ncbi:MAG: J domain-containing protein [Isosphaeraceae bacterium]